MLRNLYILSEGSWAIKSAEIFADLFYTLLVSSIAILFIVIRSDIYLIPSIELIILFILYGLFLYRNKLQKYPIALLSQLALLILVLPIAYLQPLLIFLSVLFAFLLQWLIEKSYSLRIHLVFYLLFSFFLWDGFLSVLGHPMRIVPPNSLLLPFFQNIESKSLGPLFSLPWLVGSGFEISDFRSNFEYLSNFILMGVSLVAFRRPILIFYFLGWVAIFFSYSFLMANLPFPWILNFSSMAFLLHIAPGRNFYGSFYISLITFLILLPIAMLMGKIGGQPMMILLIFFPLEAFLMRVFLGK